VKTRNLLPTIKRRAMFIALSDASELVSSIFFVGINVADSI
jgi:hypothetical protein